MFEVKFNKIGEVEESLYSRVVIVSLYKNKFVFCRQKGRDTWEIPGGHIEEGEDWLTAAKRELFEETGAEEFEIEPICVYTISKPAMLCFAKIQKMGKMPNFEIAEIGLFDTMPENATYPDTHKVMFEKVKEIKKLK